jgi:phospholipase/carboxylesterase
MGRIGGADDGREGRVRIGRRRLLGIGATGFAAAVSAGLGIDRLAGIAMASERHEQYGRQANQDRGRLSARPRPPTEPGPAGLQPLSLGGERDGLLYVPDSYRADRPAPLVLMLHGAGSNASSGLRPLRDLADEAGLILLAVDSRRKSWDVLIGGYGPDVAFVDRALAQVFTRYAVDASRVAAEGFSDGASYALSIGITNGDLFTHLMAFSPGFLAPGGQEGEPHLFISHGTQDEVLPIDACSRRIVPRVQRAGYDVQYREFDGGHTIPPEIVQEAVAWFTEA